MTNITRLSNALRPLTLFAAAAFFASPASADIDLRVQSRPNTGPIEAYIRVTDASGPMSGLTNSDFAVMLDGTAVDNVAFGLPPTQDPAQKNSVVFVINSLASNSLAVADFIDQMAVGDYAAIVRFKPGIDDPLSRPIVQPFTQIDGGNGTSILNNFLATSYRSSFRSHYENLFDGMILAIDQFVTPSVALPNGPKAIILIDSGEDSFSSESQSDVVAYANVNGIPVFTVGIGGLAARPAAIALMVSLAEDTGGNYIAGSDEAQIAEAAVNLASLLKNAYRLTIPKSAVTDCNPHTLEVTSQGQLASFAFTRCDTTPDKFQFAERTNVVPGAIIVSDAVTVTGIESPIAVAVIGGEYSISCGATFSSSPGIILPGEEICVRHTASASIMTSSSTMLTVGGVSSEFWSTTYAGPPPSGGDGSGGGGGGGVTGGGGGGGGATSVLELLFVLIALVVANSREKRQAQGATGVNSRSW